MTEPNTLAATTINSKTEVQLVGTSATAIVSNPTGSNKVLKIHALYVGNVDAATAYDLTVDLYRGGVAYRFAPTISVSAKMSLDVISKGLALQEGDSLRLTASTAGKLEAVCSYEDLA